MPPSRCGQSWRRSAGQGLAGGDARGVMQHREAARTRADTLQSWAAWHLSHPPCSPLQSTLQPSLCPRCPLSSAPPRTQPIPPPCTHLHSHPFSQAKGAAAAAGLARSRGDRACFAEGCAGQGWKCTVVDKRWCIGKVERHSPAANGSCCGNTRQGGARGAYKIGARRLAGRARRGSADGLYPHLAACWTLRPCW